MRQFLSLAPLEGVIIVGYASALHNEVPFHVPSKNASALSETLLQSREDLTGWQDETSCSSDDELPHVKLSSAMANQGSQAGGLIHAENALTLKPLLTSAEQRGSDQLPPLPPTLARETGTSDHLPVLPSRQCPPCPGSPTQPPLPPSSRSSVDGRSSMSSYMSAQATSIFSDTQSSDWVTALSSFTAASRSSLDGSSSRRGSTDGRSSFEGRPPLHGLPFKRVELGYNSSTSAASQLVQAGLLDGQCPGCGSMNECCCKVSILRKFWLLLCTCIILHIIFLGCLRQYHAYDHKGRLQQLAS